jgi:hypothetical protein
MDYSNGTMRAYSTPWPEVVAGTPPPTRVRPRLRFFRGCPYFLGRNIEEWWTATWFVVCPLSVALVRCGFRVLGVCSAVHHCTVCVCARAGTHGVRYFVRAQCALAWVDWIPVQRAAASVARAAPPCGGSTKLQILCIHGPSACMCACVVHVHQRSAWLNTSVEA